MSFSKKDHVTLFSNQGPNGVRAGFASVLNGFLTFDWILDPFKALVRKEPFDAQKVGGSPPHTKALYQSREGLFVWGYPPHTKARIVKG